ncbi:uncharacterized protein AC631_05125 [Debaryomyces fabryi]|uniref:DNA repair protein RAD50 n=1 Tax=Debaryomyces fabryi TaxID=58627 RepID=A0A0V1PSA8_9ASCO|nr:uncharacterized protein AC631_05125 [Debaryomyces fabryi]KRZ99114.1 hypothetical protein AC631_05125 [Debaryomyces fabryi]CUM47929.1 unnamed protein product [Debaryomyces fabryi]
MSSLFKLSIQGIRSFDSERHETIQFGFPLTLICGQNGCGKTTIIECLKYATTGDLPPNSKGGAFVNDPSIASRSSVTAQVKLAFLNANGKSMITTRTMQLTKKKTRSGVSSNTFKTLDGQLAVMDKGTKTTMSTKNAELDTSIPIYLGASRAILDYVIFCHQDDSLWPLSEASVLKKRFDDIFEALKFTKVLDNLKTIKKDMTTDIKLIEQSVYHLKIDKNRAKKINEKVSDLNQKVDKYTDEIASITMEIEGKEKEAESLFLSNQQFHETLSKIEHLTFIQKSYGEQINRLDKSIDKLPELDEELKEQLNNYENLTNQKSLQIKKLNDENIQLHEKLKDRRNEFNQIIRLEGSLKSKEESYKENVINLSNIIFQSQKYFGVSYTEADLKDDMKIDQFKEIIEKKQKDLKSDYNALVNKHSEDELLLEQRVQEVANSIAREKQHQEYCNDDVERGREKIIEYKKKIDQLQYNEGDLEIEKSELESLVSKYEEKKKQSDSSGYESNVELYNTRLMNLEHEMEELNRKVSASNKQSDIHAKLSLLNEAITHKSKGLSKVISNNEKLFTERTTSPLKVETCEGILNKYISLNLKDIEKKQAVVSTKSKKLDSLNAVLDSNSGTRKNYEERIAKYKERILKEITEDEIDQYEQILEDLEEDVRDTLEALNTFEVSRQFKIKSIEIAKRDEHCTLCLRAFDSPGLKNFVDLLQEDVKKMNVEELTKNVEIAKNELESTKAINSDVLQYRKLSLEVEEIISQINKSKQDVCEAKSDFELELNSLEKSRSSMDALNSLKTPINDIIRINNDIEDSHKQIEELKDELSEYGVSKMSLDELQKLQQSKNMEIKDLRIQINEINELKFTKQKEIARLENNIKDKQLAISNMERSLVDLKNLQESISENERHIMNLNKQLTEIKNTLDKFYEKQGVHNDELTKAKDINKEIREKEMSNVDKIGRIVSEFCGIYNAIKSFLQIELPKLKEVEATIKETEGLTKAIEREILESEFQIKNLEKSVNESSNFRNNIRENLEYRNVQRELEDIDNQIHSLDISNAQAKKDEYQEASKVIRNILTKLNADYAGKVGEVRQMKDQISSLQNELSNEYKNIDRTYHEEWIKLQTNMLVSNDIQTYSKALDNAIMKYHSMKMEDINRILGELWRQTYKGTDVDTISIKSDVNVQAKGNRSYNYRVVMYKQDSELDMRGRCSAGQKVLTSILIRLALAECFGANCGIIALDEPTTNLDLENTESLAQALNKIIEFRKNQKNFQLIVITHDEKFLSHINGDNFTDHFYRVQRDEHQKSIIRSLPISLIQED